MNTRTQVRILCGRRCYHPARAALGIILLVAPFSVRAQTSSQGSGSAQGNVAPASLTQLNGAFVRSNADSLQVVLDLQAKVNYTSGSLTSPNRLYIDLLNTQISPELKQHVLRVDQAKLKQIRIAQHSQNVTRVVLDLRSSSSYTISALNDPPRILVVLEGESVAKEATELDVKASAPADAARKDTQLVPAPPVPIKLDLRPMLQIPRVTRAPKLEDFLHGTPREAEARVTGFRQREPGDGTPASQQTTAYLSYDDKNLYVVFECQDNSAKIRAHMDRREQTDGDDRVAVYLDTFRDHRRAYFFATNPLGIQTDGIFNEGEREPDLTFDTLWYSEGTLTDSGYVVWIALPFKSLRFSGSELQTWGIALNRMIVRAGEDAYWPYITDRVEGFTQQFADLSGFEKISPGRNFQLIPHALFSASRSLDLSDLRHIRYDSKVDPRAGLDAKIVAKDALSFDFTVNPDFSETESDDPQVTINERFEVFFPEKRQFFIENSDYFKTPINLLFTRRIVDPQFGARVTGKVGRWALGTLVTDDRIDGEIVSPSDPLRGRRAGIGVARVRRDFGQQSSFGIFVSSYDFATSFNRVFSADTRLKLSQNWVFTGQATTSTRRNLKGQYIAGPAYLAGTDYSGRHVTYSGNYLDYSPNFDGDRLGFVKRTDIRQMNHSLNYFWRPEGRRVLSFGPTLSFLMDWDHAGRLQDRLINPGFVMNFANSTQLKFEHLEHYEVFENLGFQQRTTNVSLSTAPEPWLLLFSGASWGTQINFIAPSPLPPFLGSSSGANFGFTLRPVPQWRLDGTYFYTRLGVLQGALPPGTRASGNIFNNHLMRLKINYQFTKRLSLRAILDYDATLAKAALVSSENNKALTGNVLLTYLVHPGTALYIGYTDRYENVFFNPNLPNSLQTFGAPVHPTQRQFFVKFSYLFRF